MKKLISRFLDYLFPSRIKKREKEARNKLLTERAEYLKRSFPDDVQYPVKK